MIINDRPGDRMDRLKEKTIRGGFARLCAQGANFSLRLGSLMLFARLLRPEDFGLVSMVTAFTGVLGLFRDFGLSSAAVQRINVTDAQISTLFWINMLVGVLLALFTVLMAPAIATFYYEPRLVPVAAVLATGFIFNAAGVQHGVLLQRELRFTALAVINTVSLTVATAIAVGSAVAGHGYWALVVMAVTLPLVNTIGCWLATAWVPGRPRRRVGIHAMMDFGGTVTLNGLIYYFANNFDKILLGRAWGVEALGIYGRAYQLISIPTDNLNGAASDVALSALSRLQEDPKRLRSYFLKGYSLTLAMTLPATIAGAVFADDVTTVFLGPKWNSVAPIFRLLAPAILVFAIVNPLGWLLNSLGLVRRGLKMSFVVSPLLIVAITLGLPYGPTGVAVAYSTAMVLWVLPAIAWAVRDTVLSSRDIIWTATQPLIASAVASAVALAARSLCGDLLTVLPRLVLESTVFLLTFSGVILFVMGQKSHYMDLLRMSKGSSAPLRNDGALPIKTLT